MSVTAAELERVAQYLEAWPTLAHKYAASVRAVAKELEQLRQHRCSLPDSIQEALNSGDGVYRP